MIEKKVAMNKKASIEDMLKFIHQAEQLGLINLGVEIQGDRLSLVLGCDENQQQSLHDFVKGKVYYQSMRKFKVIK